MKQQVTTYFVRSISRLVSCLAILVLLITLVPASAVYAAPSPTDVPAFHSMINRFDPESTNGKFDDPKAMAFDSSGNIYVVDRNNFRVQKFDSNGNYLLKWGSYGSGNGEFDSPRSIGIDSSNNVYVGDIGRNNIQKFDSNGNFISKFGSSGPGNGELASPYGIDFDSSGNMFVVDRYNDRVQKFDNNGTYISQFGTNGSGDGELDLPGGIVIDSSNNIYVSDYGNSRVQKFSSAGTYISQFGTGGSADGELYEHYGLDVDSTGNIYVADRGNQRIQKFNSSGAFVATWGANGGDGTSGDGDGEFDSPSDVRVDSAGHVYVVDEDNDRIQKFTNTGTYISQFGEYGTLENSGSNADGKFNAPRDMAQDSQGSIYVADGANSRIQKFNKNGNFIAKWGANGGDGSSGTGNGEFNFPESIAIDASDNIYVGEANNYRVQKLDKNGNFIAKWGANGGDGSSGSADGEFNGIRGVAIAPDGNLLVVDDGNYRIQKINSTSGAFISKFGTSGSGDGQFDSPAGIAVDSAGNIYVADMYNYRIQKFDSAGIFVSKWGQNGTGDGEFDAVSAVDVDSQGNVYALDYGNNRIQKFDTSGNFLAKWGSAGTGDGQFDNPEGMRVSSNGNTVLVADSDNHRIQIFKYGADSQSEGGSSNNNTASLTNAGDGKLVQLMTPGGTNLTCSNTIQEVDQTSQDQAFDYPLGLVEFCFSSTNTSNQVSLTFVTDLTPGQVVARKYNSNTGEYFDISGASIEETTVQGKHALRLTYTITDNGKLDLDPTTGSIKDPVGLAVTDNDQGGLVNTGAALLVSGGIAVAIALLTGWLAANSRRRTSIKS